MGLLTGLAVSSAAVLYGNARLARLIPDARATQRLSARLVHTEPGASVLTLLLNRAGDVGWNSPVLHKYLYVSPDVTDCFAVNFPVFAGCSVRLFRPYAYMEKLNVGLAAAGAKVRDMQCLEAQDFLSLLSQYVKLVKVKSGLLSVNYFASVRARKAMSTELNIFPRPLRKTPPLPLTVGESLEITAGGKVIDSRFGPLFLRTTRGLLTPRLNSDDGLWSGVRSNVLRDTVMRLRPQVGECDVHLSELFDTSQTKEAFVASDDCLLIPVQRLDSRSQSRTFDSSAETDALNSEIEHIHTGKTPKVTLCTDRYTEESWSCVLTH